MASLPHLVHVYGLWAVAACVGLESLGIPLPGETALITGALIAGKTHDLGIVAVIVTAIAASLVGRIIGYLIGAKFGYWLLLRYGSYVWITEARIKLGQYLFLRHGGKIVIVAQFVPFLRAIAGILAGANRMPWRNFLLASFTGIFVWANFFGFAAYSFGREIEQMAGSVMLGLGFAIVGLLIAAAHFLGRHEAQLAAEAERVLPGPLDLP
jgi:membrane protein DedA with SNARE-associated domain